MSRKGIALVVLVPLLVSCGSSGTSVFNSGRTNVVDIQASFREDVLSAFDVVEKEDLVIAEVQSSEERSLNPVVESAESKAWRASVTEPWKELGSGKGDEVCKIFFDGLMNPDSTLGAAFAPSRERFKSEGKTIYSLTDASMIEDNRKTIQMPTAQSSSPLFICEAKVVLKLPTQELSAPKTLIFYWNYFLDQEEIKWTFSFTFKDN